MARLKERYQKEIAPAVAKEFGIKNPMAIPRLDKIIINMGMGEATQNSKILDPAVNELGQITGQKPIHSSRQAQFQIVDVIASMRPLTKHTRQIISAASIPTLVREAFRTAMEERPGPVHLELPEDVEIRVWDSTAELRYLVLPERPAGSENLSEEELAALATRDAMVGVGKVTLAQPGGRA